MKLLLIADGRSPHTRGWISMLKPLNWQIVLVSSYPCDPIEGLHKLHILPLAFGQHAGSAGSSSSTKKPVKQLVNKFRPAAQWVRYQLGPWSVTSQVEAFNAILESEKPDLVHALRIPFEGMLASYTPPTYPVVLSTWGNDLTLHASSTPKMSSMTRKALQRANGLISDTLRDLSLAAQWGFSSDKPRLSVPGNGGLDLPNMLASVKQVSKPDYLKVINPRGIRTKSVRVDTFFQSIPLVLQKQPDAKFICFSMAGQSEALDWVKKLGVERSVSLLPTIPRQEVWREFASSQIMLSISEHDGTPNSLLEAMALGCLPICGDIESIREWILPGENGLLVNPADHRQLADTILEGVKNQQLQASAAAKNLDIITQRASIHTTLAKVKEFYAGY